MKIPISIFLNNAGPLESLVRYLHDEKKMSSSEISKRLGRNIQTIFTTLRNTSSKKFVFSTSKYEVPLLIFSKDKFSIFESLIHYLRTNYNLKNSDVSRLLSLDQRNTHTYYSRYLAKEKLKSGGK